MANIPYTRLIDVLGLICSGSPNVILYYCCIGTDHAGIATQLQVEKQLLSEGTTREEIGREEFLKRVWEYKAEQGGHITDQLRSLGASADWSRERFTMDSDLCEAVSEAFVRLHEKGLVYRGEYIVNWAPLLKTAVSDLEVEYSEEEGKLYFFKYMVEGSDGKSARRTNKSELYKQGSINRALTILSI